MASGSAGTRARRQRAVCSAVLLPALCNCGRIGFEPSTSHLGADGATSDGGTTDSDAAAGDAAPLPAGITLLPNLAQGTGCEGTTLLPLGQAVEAGTVLWVTVGQRTPTTTGTIAVTDSAGSVYQRHVASSLSGSLQLEVWSAVTAAPLPAGTQVTVSHEPAAVTGALIDAVAGLPTSADRILGTAQDSWPDTATPALSIDLPAAPAMVHAALGFANPRGVIDEQDFTTASEISGDCGGAPRKGTLHTAWRFVNTAGVVPYSATVSGPETVALALVGHRAPPL